MSTNSIRSYRRLIPQPTRPFPLDLNNPLTRDLVCATYSGDSVTFFDMANWRFFTERYAGGSFFRNNFTKWGRGRATGGGNYANVVSNLPPTNTPGRQTIMVLCRPKKLPTTTNNLLYAGDVAGWYIGIIDLTTEGRFVGRPVNATAPFCTSDPITPNEFYAVGLVCRSNPDDDPLQRLFINGKQQGADSNYTNAYGRNLRELTITGTQVNDAVEIYAIFAWGRDLSDAEMAEMATNPYQVFDQRMTPSQSLFRSSAAPVPGPLRPIGEGTFSVGLSSTGTIRQRQRVAGVPTASSSISGSSTVKQHHRTTGAVSGAGSTSSVGATSQLHRVAGAGTDSEATSSSGTITLRGKLAGTPTDSRSVSAVGAIGQAHKLTGSDSAAVGQSTVGAIVSRHRVAGAASAAQGNSMGNGVRQRHRIRAQPTSSAGSSTEGSILNVGRSDIDASKVPPVRTVKFAGCQRMVIFSGGKRVVTFNGGTRIVRF